VCFAASFNTGSWPRLKGDVQGALCPFPDFLAYARSCLEAVKDSPDEDRATGHQDDRVMKGLHAYLIKGRYTHHLGESSVMRLPSPREDQTHLCTTGLHTGRL